MDNWWYRNKPLTLNKILEELEKDEEEIPEEIIIFPPDNANADLTDEDSGDDDNVVISNLPGGQLRAETQLRYTQQTEMDKDGVDEDNIVVNNLSDSQHGTEARLRYSSPTESDYDSENDIPLAVIAKRRKKPSKSFTVNKATPISFKWDKKDLISNLPTWNDVAGCNQQMSPTEAFQKFFDEELTNLLIRYTNMYAVSHNRKGDVHPNEMRCFIGILLLSGYVRLARRHLYWESSKDTYNELVCNAMSRNRFRFIMQNLHCSDNRQLNTSDKFAKIRPLFDMLNKKFIEMAPKEENHSVDESMVPYYGHHGTKQFIRGKPIRWGYRLWTGTTKSGYIEWFEPYQGSTTILPEKFKHLGLGASVVLQCADVLQNNSNMPYHLYFDNFFTSIKLLEELRCGGLKGTGTIRENRIGKNCNILDSKVIKKKKEDIMITQRHEAMK